MPELMIILLSLLHILPNIGDILINILALLLIQRLVSIQWYGARVPRIGSAVV